MTTTISADISDDVVGCIGELSVGVIGHGVVRIVADRGADRSRKSPPNAKHTKPCNNGERSCTAP
jgi:hypothetical protein